ncbi:HAD family hydrolase [Streptomyces fructofermentans]|uniref:hypothetical protein n=1 Tax=Streptomyces fructofermentans TaxID=152141 RepID=UPI0033C4239D
MLVAAARLGVAPADCLAVEDAPAGLRPAGVAGMRRIGLTTAHPAALLEADLLVADLSGLCVKQERAGLMVDIAPDAGCPEVRTAMSGIAPSRL